MDYRITIRYGTGRQRYHLADVEATDLREALRKAAEAMPDEVAAEGDLAEIRPAIDPEGREYSGTDR